MQSNLFDDLKILKEKLNLEEKNHKEKIAQGETLEKEQKLQNQFIRFMKESGIKKLS